MRICDIRFISVTVLSQDTDNFPHLCQDSEQTEVLETDDKKVHRLVKRPSALNRRRTRRVSTAQKIIKASEWNTFKQLRYKTSK